MTPSARISGIFLIALATGCAALREAPPGAMTQTAPLAVDPSLIGTRQPVTAATDVPPVAKAAEPLIEVAPAKVAAAPPPTAVKTDPPRKNEDPPPAARKAEPALDVAALKARLRDTNAIGVFTKLTLKNQMDDLLKQFRAHHQSGQKTGVASLRQPYDMLVLKVLSVVQDGDPSLARTIAGSREAIWTILADPEKFNAAT